MTGQHVERHQRVQRRGGYLVGELRRSVASASPLGVDGAREAFSRLTALYACNRGEHDRSIPRVGMRRLNAAAGVCVCSVSPLGHRVEPPAASLADGGSSASGIGMSAEWLKYYVSRPGVDDGSSAIPSSAVPPVVLQQSRPNLSPVRAGVPHPLGVTCSKLGRTEAKHALRRPGGRGRTASGSSIQRTSASHCIAGRRSRHGRGAAC
jgi:hypothetical protein